MFDQSVRQRPKVWKWLQQNLPNYFLQKTSVTVVLLQTLKLKSTFKEPVRDFSKAFNFRTTSVVQKIEYSDEHHLSKLLGKCIEHQHLSFSISNSNSPNQQKKISQLTSCCCILFWENAKGDEPHPTSRMPNSSSVHSSRDEIILESKSSSRDDHLQSNSVERAALLHISFLIFGTPTTF